MELGKKRTGIFLNAQLQHLTDSVVLIGGNSKYYLFIGLNFVEEDREFRP
jgi:hypothetical protein